MKHMIKLKLLSSNSSYKLCNSNLFINQVRSLANFSKSAKFSKNKSHLQGQLESTTFNSLFNQITEILGTNEVIPEKNSSGFSVSQQNYLENGALNGELKSCSPSVCENAELNKTGVFSELGDARVRNLDVIDVSPVVHEITSIVRAAENGVASMEERLEELEFRFEPEVVEKVLKRCFKVPHLAFRFFNWVKKKDGFCHTTATYNTMLYIASEAKEFAVVRELVGEMEINCCKKDVKTWSILISQFGKAKLIGKALFFFEKMKKSVCEPDDKIYGIMIHSLCDAGKGEIALELYKEMVQKNMTLNLRLYKILLNSMAKSGDVDAVHLVADDMVRILQIPERDVYVCTLKTFCVVGRITEALELIRDLKDKDILIDYEFLETLVRGLCRADRIDDALEIVEIMRKKDLLDAKIYGIIINGYLRRRELLKATELFESMKDSGYQPATSTYTELMQHLFNLSQYGEGFELFNEMKARGIEVDSVASMAIIVAHVRQDQISEAWEVFNEMEDKGVNFTWKSYSVFIKELCKVSRTDDIMKVLDKIQASKLFIDNEILKLVISFMEKKGEIDNVHKVKQMQRMFSIHSVQDKVSGIHKLQKEQSHNQSEQLRIYGHLMNSPVKSFNEKDSENGRIDCCLVKADSKR